MKPFRGYCADRHRGKRWGWAPIYRRKAEAVTYSRYHSVLSVTVLPTDDYTKMQSELTRLRDIEARVKLLQDREARAKLLEASQKQARDRD